MIPMMKYASVLMALAFAAGVLNLVVILLGAAALQTSSPVKTTLGWSLEPTQAESDDGQSRWEVEVGETILACENSRIEEGERRCDVALDRSRPQTIRLRRCAKARTLSNGASTSDCQGAWSVPLVVPSLVPPSATLTTADPLAPGQPRGAAAFGSLSTTTYEARTNTTVAAPPGVQDGDILLLAHVIGAALPAGPPEVTLPAGFRVIEGPSEARNPAFAVARRLAVKVAAREPRRYIATHAQARSQGVIIRVTGGTLTGLVSSNNSGTGDTSTALGVTTAADGGLAIYIDHNWQAYGTASPPTGSTPAFTERLDGKTSLIYVATGVLATAGATGDVSHGNLNATAYPPDPWGAFLVGIGASGAASRSR